MAAKKYIVKLSKQDKKVLRDIVKKGMNIASVRCRAHILLKSGKGMIDKVIAEHLDCHEDSVRDTRKRFCDSGLDDALYGYHRSGRPREITDEQRLKTVAIACTEAPENHSHWSLQLLAKEVVKQGIVPSISHEGVRIILQEHDLKPHLKKNVVCSKVK